MTALATLLYCCYLLRSISTATEAADESGDSVSLLDRQIPDDVVFGLAGRKTLITQDRQTEQYNTFKMYEDQGVPFVVDPESGRKYVVKYSLTSAEVDIYPVVATGRRGRGKGRGVTVRDGATDTLHSVTLNKYGEVELAQPYSTTVFNRHR